MAAVGTEVRSDGQQLAVGDSIEEKSGSGGRMIRFGLAGLGRIGAVHARNIAAHAKAELAAVFARRGESLVYRGKGRLFGSGELRGDTVGRLNRRGDRYLHVHHHDQTDHFRRAVEISERVAHGLTLAWPDTVSVSSDKALASSVRILATEPAQDM
jgi:hypothetical protein